jgi:hypothetical protein
VRQPLVIEESLAMNPKAFVLRLPNPRRFAVMVFVLVLLLVTAIGSQAQSGRPPKQPKSPDPIPSKQENSPIAALSEKDSKPQTRVMVVWHLYDPSTMADRLLDALGLPQPARR